MSTLSSVGRFTGAARPIPVNRSGRPDINALIGQMVNRTRRTVYDRVRLPSGEIREFSPCFRVPVGHPGADGSVRTFTDTNMYSGGRFDPPRDLILERVLFLFQPSGLQSDRNEMLSHCTWRLSILEKTLTIQPVLSCAVVGKPQNLIKGFGETVNGKDHSALKIKKLGTGAAWDLRSHKVYIPPLVNFKVEIFGEPFKTKRGLDFYVMLDGLGDEPAL